jgi:hypothetical protein
MSFNERENFQRRSHGSSHQRVPFLTGFNDSNIAGITLTSEQDTSGALQSPSTEEQRQLRSEAYAGCEVQPFSLQTGSLEGNWRELNNTTIVAPNTMDSGAGIKQSATSTQPQGNEEPTIDRQQAPRCYDHGCNGRTFSCQENYLRHLREKQGKSTVKCRFCGATFTRRSNRDKHLANGICSTALARDFRRDDWVDKTTQAKMDHHACHRLSQGTESMLQNLFCINDNRTRGMNEIDYTLCLQSDEPATTDSTSWHGRIKQIANQNIKPRILQKPIFRINIHALMNRQLILIHTPSIHLHLSMQLRRFLGVDGIMHIPMMRSSPRRPEERRRRERTDQLRVLDLQQFRHADGVVIPDPAIE